MIIKVDDTYHSKVINYLKREADFNLFIIGDIERYGYDNYFLDIWADINKKGRIEGVLLRYFEYLIFYAQGKFNIDEFANLINSLNYIEISGKLVVFSNSSISSYNLATLLILPNLIFLGLSSISISIISPLDL